MKNIYFKGTSDISFLVLFQGTRAICTIKGTFAKNFWEQWNFLMENKEEFEKFLRGQREHVLQSQTVIGNSSLKREKVDKQLALGSM